MLPSRILKSPIRRISIRTLGQIWAPVFMQKGEPVAALELTGARTIACRDLIGPNLAAISMCPRIPKCQKTAILGHEKD